MIYLLIAVSSIVATIAGYYGEYIIPSIVIGLLITISFINRRSWKIDRQ